MKDEDYKKLLELKSTIDSCSIARDSASKEFLAFSRKTNDYVNNLQNLVKISLLDIFKETSYTTEKNIIHLVSSKDFIDLAKIDTNIRCAFTNGSHIYYFSFDKLIIDVEHKSRINDAIKFFNLKPQKVNTSAIKSKISTLKKELKEYEDILKQESEKEKQ